MVTKGVAAKVNFKMVDETTYLPLTGLTVTTELSVDSGAFGSTTNSAVEIGDGWYYIELTAIETDYDEIVLKATATGAAQSDGIINPASASTGSTTTNITTQGGGSAAALMYASNCSWMDSDIKAVTTFFKKYKDHMDAINADREPMAQVDTKLSEFVLETNKKFTEVTQMINELLQSQEKIELLLLKNTTLDDLEAFDGIN